MLLLVKQISVPILGKDSMGAARENIDFVLQSDFFRLITRRSSVSNLTPATIRRRQFIGLVSWGQDWISPKQIPVPFRHVKALFRPTARRHPNFTGVLHKLSSRERNVLAQKFNEVTAQGPAELAWRLLVGAHLTVKPITLSLRLRRVYYVGRDGHGSPSCLNGVNGS